VRRLRAKILANVRARLAARSRQGRIPPAPADQARREAAVGAALDFKIALLRHRPAPLAAAAFVLASRQRLESDWRPGGPQRRLFADVRLFEVGGEHDDVLDPGNERFAESLARCLEAAHAALGAGGCEPPAGGREVAS